MGASEASSGEFATEDEVKGAISALSPVKLRRLSRVAALRARALSAYRLGVDGNDLLQEGIRRTLDGRRRWKRGVGFDVHLYRTMESICSHAPGSAPPDSIVGVAAEHPSSPHAAELLSGVGDGARTLSAKEQLDAIRSNFANDEQIQLLIDALGEEMTGPEIQDLLGITATQFETLMTRLRRGLDRAEGWRS